MTKALITGATGFLGANLTRRCLREGIETHVILRQESNSWRINDVLSELQQHKTDLLCYNKLETICQRVKPDIIFHSGAYGTFPKKQSDIDRIINTNIVGSTNLVKATDNVDYSHFINFGSSSEYGAMNAPMLEDQLPEPMSIYAASKASSTILLQTWARIKNKPIITIRPFSVYGFFEEPIRLIPTTIWHCLKNINLELSDGAKSMDFIFIEDFTEACIRLTKIPCISGEILNLGTGEAHSVREVVTKIHRFTDSSISLLWGKLERDVNAPKVWVADPTKLNRFLKWRPQVNLDIGLKKSIDWMKKNMSRYEEIC